jgi:CheY-like chemotaxis protein
MPVPDFEPSSGFAAVIDAVPGPSESRPLVLVVDDERDVLDALEAALLSQGWRVVTAVNGGEALGKALELRPDLVVTDLLMPVIDGIGLAKLLRADPRTAATCIVLCSGVSEASVRGLFDGYDAFLRKPYELDDLRRAMGVLRPRTADIAAPAS